MLHAGCTGRNFSLQESGGRLQDAGLSGSSEHILGPGGVASDVLEEGWSIWRRVFGSAQSTAAANGAPVSQVCTWFPISPLVPS